MGWKDEDDQTPRVIDSAMRSSKLTEVRRLFSDHPEFLRLENGLDTWLWGAAFRGDLPLVRLLVELGIGVNESNDKEMTKTAIDSAAGSGHLEVVRWLLDHGAEINHIYKGSRHCPALTYAAYKGHLDVVKLLVERGAEIHDSWMCMNALMHAQDYGQQEIVEYLRALGVKDLRETTPPDYHAAHRLIINHMIEQFGSLSSWQADIPGDPAVTIRGIAANEQSPGEQTLFTVGLSDRRLSAEWGEFACGELKLTLPADWPLPESAQIESDWNWPIEWLKRIVRELRNSDRWPATPVMFPNGTPPAPFNSETKLCCWLCLLSQGGSIQVPDCRWIDFHGLFPIYEEEVQLVRERGHEALISRFQARGLPSNIVPNRPNVAWDPDPQE